MSIFNDIIVLFHTQTALVAQMGIIPSLLGRYNVPLNMTCTSSNTRQITYTRIY